MSLPYTSTILITGGTTGIGYETALHLARLQPTTEIIISSRNPGKNNDAAGTINKALSQSNVTFLPLDLSSKADIRRFCTSYSSSNPPRAPIKALIPNAGIQLQANETKLSVDGIELSFAITHVGHALLFYLLRPYLAPDARIVITSSGVHDVTKGWPLPVLPFSSGKEVAYATEKGGGLQRYSTSKLCNVLWTYALDRRIQDTATAGGKRWTVTAMCPGLMPGTAIMRDAPAPVRALNSTVGLYMIPLMRKMMKKENVHSPKESGMALAQLAVGDEFAGVSGKYLEGTREIKSSDDSYMRDKQDDLWNWTAEFVAENAAEAASFKSLS
ncbi:NAD(P)-binding protein [Aulographum hederae CBS 113979]|uniref:NAD(P)-binding protein n=1 Tax=Aulographum hederae CBS 113979 TaxID=1176131 RepID=A0A6G1H7A4_9PEZI|nr:NAD(P)-binding protein [Aulographum hederae CBS 113979]